MQCRNTGDELNVCSCDVKRKNSYSSQVLMAKTAHGVIDKCLFSMFVVRSGRRWHPEPSDEPKNLIFMISDGYGSPEQTLTRLVLEVQMTVILDVKLGGFVPAEINHQEDKGFTENELGNAVMVPTENEAGNAVMVIGVFPWFHIPFVEEKVNHSWKSRFYIVLDKCSHYMHGHNKELS